MLGTYSFIAVCPSDPWCPVWASAAASLGFGEIPSPRLLVRGGGPRLREIPLPGSAVGSRCPAGVGGFTLQRGSCGGCTTCAASRLKSILPGNLFLGVLSQLPAIHIAGEASCWLKVNGLELREVAVARTLLIDGPT